MASPDSVPNLVGAAPLTGRSVIVTGGNGGIGLGLAHGVAAAGASVSIWGRNESKNVAAVEQLRAHGTAVHSVVCDVSSEDQVVSAFAETVEVLGSVDSMFANAGIPGDINDFTSLSYSDWRSVLAVNLDGTFLCLREAVRHMVETGNGGSLIGVSSIVSFYGSAKKAAYGVSKAGIEALMRALAVELAPHRIRANSLLPGWTDTDLLAAGNGFIDAKNHDAVKTYTIQRTPARRWAAPDEFAAAAVFLADPTITFHTGDRLVLDGGYTIF